MSDRPKKEDDEIVGIVSLPHVFDQKISKKYPELNKSPTKPDLSNEPFFTYQTNGVKVKRTFGWQTKSNRGSPRESIDSGKPGRTRMKRSNSEPHFWFDEETVVSQNDASIGHVQEALDRGRNLFKLHVSFMFFSSHHLFLLSMKSM